MGSAEQPRLTRISLDDDSIEELLMMRVGPDLYRLEESSVFGEVQYHDIVEAETQTDGTLRFLRVATPSGLKLLPGSSRRLHLIPRFYWLCLTE